MKDKKEPRINMDSKAAKYFVKNRIEKKSKVVAAREAGISNINNVYNMEQTKTYKALEAKYADKLEKILALDEVAEEHAKIIKQDKDQGAKLNAIKYYKDQVQPDETKKDDDDKMIIVFR